MYSDLSPNVVKTALDDVFKDGFEIGSAPDFASVEDPMVLNQQSHDSSAFIHEELKGGGLWDTKDETQNASVQSSRTGNQNTASITTYARTEDIPKEFFDDAKHGTVQESIRLMGRNGRVTREQQGMSVFRLAFSGATYGDGAALCADSHTLLSGGTQDNKLTATLSPTSLESAIVALAQQKSQDGVVLGMRPRCLVVPPALYKEAVEITEAKLIPQSADNDPNVFSVKYGITVKQTPYIGAAISGGSDTAWFLLGEFTGLTRFIREPLSTVLIPWQYARNHNYQYTGRYRETVNVKTHIGIVGSDGSV